MGRDMNAPALPHALGHLPDIVGDGALALFADFDGTLAHIVDHPERAVLAPGTGARLEALARIIPVGILSGRDLGDIRSRVGIDGIYYAGSHGFDIAGPHGEHAVLDDDTEPLRELAEAASRIRERTNAIAGLFFEHKRHSLAVHFRRASEADAAAVLASVDQVAGSFPLLRQLRGKAVVEIQPDIEWHKGKALRWLMTTAGLDGRRPLYIGDDVTDEDAFREVLHDGVGILVAQDRTATHGRYRLSDPTEVASFLEELLAWLRPGDGPSAGP